MSTFKIILEIETDIEEVNGSIDEAEKYLQNHFNSGHSFGIESIRYGIKKILSESVMISSEEPFIGCIKVKLK